MPETKCYLTVQVRRTDFDGGGDEGEEVEWVRVNGHARWTHLAPRGNPCKQRLQKRGEPLEEYATVVDVEDITTEAARGLVVVTAKISSMVDECPSPEGHLLDAVAR